MYPRLSNQRDQMTKVIRPYEVVVIIRPEASEELQKQVFKKNEEIVKAHSGKVHSLETWGKRILGNSIRKHRKGIFFHMLFEADNAAIAELDARSIWPGNDAIHVGVHKEAAFERLLRHYLPEISILLHVAGIVGEIRRPFIRSNFAD